MRKITTLSLPPFCLSSSISLSSSSLSSSSRAAAPTPALQPTQCDKKQSRCSWFCYCRTLVGCATDCACMYSCVWQCVQWGDWGLAGARNQGLGGTLFEHRCCPLLRITILCIYYITLYIIYMISYIIHMISYNDYISKKRVPAIKVLVGHFLSTAAVPWFWSFDAI